MIQLRNYQHDLISDIRSEMRKAHNNIVAQSPTGSGKTVIFSFMTKQASANGLRCMVLTNRIELLEQAGGTFDKFDIHFENITANTKRIPIGRVLVAMVETIKRRCASRLDFQMLLRSIDLLIIDEVHIAAFDPVFAFLKPECYVIGFTATPVRQSTKKLLSDNFTSLVTGPSISSLIADGFLASPKYYGVSVDVSKIKMKAGEFDERSQEDFFSDVKLFSGLKENIAKHAPNKKTMIFCPSVASSKQVAHDLNCLHIDGTMAPAERDRILTEFETTPGAMLTNCAITTTGYDCPDIECIILYRATTSLPLFLQMIGRGSRVTPIKKNFTILDFGMNIQRHGYWHIERTWSLDQPKKKKKKKDSFPVKFCPQCSAILSVNVKSCEYCGYVWPITEKERIFAELQEMSYQDVQSKIAAAKTVDEMEQIRIAKGYKVGYLLHKFKSEQQFVDYAKLKGYHPAWVPRQVERYLKK